LTNKSEAHELYHRTATDIAHGPVHVETDNKGAHDLCHRVTTGPTSRHVERKVNKMRELQREGKVRVTHVPTDDNAADIFTKVLGNIAFAKHRATIYNVAAAPSEAKVNTVIAGKSKLGADHEGKEPKDRRVAHGQSARADESES
jgi:hypothetical protein